MKKLWLVRSGIQVVGPFTVEEIEDKIRKKELHEFDVAADPMGYWHALSEYKVFHSVIAEVSVTAFDDNSDDSEFLSVDKSLQFINAGSKGKEGQAPKIKLELRSSDNDLRADKAVKPQPETRSSRPFVSRVSKTVSSPPPRTIFKRRKKTNWITPVMGSLVALIVAIVALQYFTPQYFQMLLSHWGSVADEPFLIQAQERLDVGDYRSAESIYRDLFQKGNQDKNFKINYALLLLHQQKNKAALNIIATIPQGLSRKKIELLVAMNNVDWNQAEKISGNIQIAEEDVIINDAFVKFKLKQYGPANSRILALINENIRVRPEAYIILAESNFQLYKRSKNISFIEQTYSHLEENLEPKEKYYPESLLIMSYTSLLRGLPMLSTSFLRNIFSIPFDYNQQFKDNISIHYGIAKNIFFLNWCTDIIKGIDINLLSLQLKAYCELKYGDKKEAAKIVDRMENFKKNDPVTASLFYKLHRSGPKSQEAIQRLKNSVINSNGSTSFFLNHYQMAKLCESQKKYNCSEKHWKKISSKSPGALTAKVGLARIYLLQKKMKEFKKKMKELSGQANNYLPYLQLDQFAKQFKKETQRKKAQ